MARTMEAARKHIHNEALKLMTYRCEGCGHQETIWNSRDGVTPFGCNCPSCTGIMRHINWQRDVYAPNHVLRNGQGFWDDGTPDEAEAIMRKRIEMMRDKWPLTPESEAALIASAHDESEGEFQKGWPTLRRAT